MIPRQCFRSFVAQKLCREYIPKTQVVENLIELWYDQGLKGHSIIILADSWYSSERMIRKCFDLDMVLISGLKSNRKLNKKQISKYQTGVRRHERVEMKTDKYLYRLYLRHGTLSRIKEPINVLLSQRISLSSGKKTWRYLVCTGLNYDVTEILDWYRKRWAVETFHQIWKSLFGAKNWRLQSVHGIQNLATITVMTIGFSVYVFMRLHNNRYDIVNSCLDHCVIAMAMSEAKQELICGKVLSEALFYRRL